jgi:hypothetical protein
MRAFLAAKERFAVHLRPEDVYTALDAQSRSADFRILARRLAQVLDGYHGDLDWGGVRIATALARSVPWRPWRYTAGEYRAVVTTLAEASALRGPPAATPWDPALAVALPERGVWVEEETVLNDLLTDLGTRSG